jgi:hypothetical protein
MTDQLEQRLVESLTRRANALDSQKPSVEQSWQRVGTMRRRRHQARIVISMMCCLALLGACAAAYSIRRSGRSQPVAQRQKFDPDFRLLPKWLPSGLQREYLVAENQHLEQSQMKPTFGRVRQWAKNDKTAILYETKFSSQVALDGQSLEDAVLLLPHCPEESQCGLAWVNSNTQFNVRTTGISRRELFDIGETIQANGKSVEFEKPPLGMPLILDDQSGPTDPPVSFWSVRHDIDQSELSISAFPVGVERLGPDETWSEGELTTVRGLPARVTKRTDTQRMPFPWGSVSITFQEAGWSVTVSSSSVSHAKRITESLERATPEEFDALKAVQPGVSDKPRSEREKPTNEVMSAATGSAGSIKIAETQTAAGCVNVLISGGASDENVCVQFTDGAVAWSGVRTLGGKRVLIVLTGPPGDGIRLTNTKTDGANPVVAKDVGAVSTSGVFVERPEEQGYGWIGAAMLEVKDSQTSFELFTNEVDDGSSAALTHEQTADSLPVSPDPDYGDQLVRPVGLFPIPKS